MNCFHFECQEFDGWMVGASDGESGCSVDVTRVEAGGERGRGRLRRVWFHRQKRKVSGVKGEGGLMAEVPQW